MSVRWAGVFGDDAWQLAACRRILSAAGRAISERGSFLIVLAGGRTPLETYRRLRAAGTDWSRWQVYFGDERCVPGDDAERNSRQARDAWLDHVPIPGDHVHVIPTELGSERAAAAYAELLRDVGEFDLVLLGLGEDGHTASLFPHHAWDIAGADVLAVLDAPKPPAQRVSLSAARLGRSREVLFLVNGESKREAVARWRAGEDLPAAAIRPAAGVDVLVDAALLTPR
jgi:6-phosphogluconolactonase